MKSSLLTILQTAAWAMALPAMEAGARAGQRKAARRKAAPGRTIGWMEMLRKLAPADCCSSWRRGPCAPARRSPTRILMAGSSTRLVPLPALSDLSKT